METVIKRLSVLTTERLRCKVNGNKEMEIKHKDSIEHIVHEYLPSLNGIDHGTKFDYEASTGEKIVLRSSIERMDSSGFILGYVTYELVVRASLKFGIHVTLYGNFRVFDFDSRDIEKNIIRKYYTALSMDVG